MDVPDYQTLMLPTRQATGDGAEHPVQEPVEQVVSDPSGTECDGMVGQVTVTG